MQVFTLLYTTNTGFGLSSLSEDRSSVSIERNGVGDCVVSTPERLAGPTDGPTDFPRQQLRTTVDDPNWQADSATKPIRWRPILSARTAFRSRRSLVRRRSDRLCDRRAGAGSIARREAPDPGRGPGLCPHPLSHGSGGSGAEGGRGPGR